MNATDEKRRLRDLLYRQVIHANWVREDRVHPHWLDLRLPADDLPEQEPREVKPGVRCLSDDEVRAIRAVWRPWDRTCSAPVLARRYGVPLDTMKKVVAGVNYRDVV